MPDPLTTLATALRTFIADRDWGVDPLEAAEAKLAKNEAKYPADTVRGSAKKYDEY